MSRGVFGSGHEQSCEVAKWGNFVIDPGFFTRLVYEGV
jgi:hypothetical protein